VFPATVIALPDLGSIAWTCGGTGRRTLFSTTFTVPDLSATEKVGYSLDGGPVVSRTLQPGQHMSTPLTPASSHVWTVEQPIKPYVSTATITVTLGPTKYDSCFNPKVTVVRVRKSSSG
jgi:hypothetical protein